MPADPSRLTSTVDFERPGRQVGYLGLTHSNNRHAYGVLPVPVACIANGSDPTALITAGNHGDEHEGPIICRRLIRELDPTGIRGRLIIMPALNYPAVLADARVSPLDDGNMNRAFPGDAAGPPTSVMRGDYVFHVGEPVDEHAIVARRS